MKTYTEKIGKNVNAFGKRIFVKDKATATKLDFLMVENMRASAIIDRLAEKKKRTPAEKSLMSAKRALSEYCVRTGRSL